MKFGDNFFKGIENKTNVSKETIMNLANKLQKGDMKDENTLRELVHEIGSMTGKTVSKEREDKIISAVVNDNVSESVKKMSE